MPEQQHNETIDRLAAMIGRTGLRAPVAFVLDILKPFDVLSSQAALFVRPFTLTIGREWEHYALALSEEANWGKLRLLLEDHDNENRNDEGDNGKKPEKI
jgi:hypothetical protein